MILNIFFFKKKKNCVHLLKSRVFFELIKYKELKHLVGSIEGRRVITEAYSDSLASEDILYPL